MSSGAPNNLSGLTSLRGIAAILVMAHNYTLTFYPDIQKLSSTKFLEKSYLWVDMFFLLSGFVLCHVYQTTFRTGIALKTYKAFSLARFARIYPLHIFLLLFLIALEGMSYFLGGTSPVRSTKTIVENIFLLQVFNPYTFWNEPSWSISAEWLTYIFVPFFIFFIFKLHYTLRLLVFTACLLGLYAIEFSFGDFGIRYSGWPLYLRCILEVIIGINLYHLYAQRKLSKRLVAIGIPVILALVLFTISIELPHTLTILLFIPLIYTVAHLDAADSHWLNRPMLIWLGTISYSIYMIHDPVKQTFVAVTTWLDLPMDGAAISYHSQLLVIFFCISVSVLFAHFSYLLIENPSRRRIRAFCSPS